MKKSDFLSEMTLRTATAADIPDLRRLVNSAYKELADMGLNYTAADQDENKTRERLATGEAFVLTQNSKIIGTILFRAENHFTNKNTAYLAQFAIAPELKRNGLGAKMMDYCENLARERNFQGVQLDTAKPATHLVQWYLRRGYTIIGEKQWEGKTYGSWVFEKEF